MIPFALTDDGVISVQLAGLACSALLGAIGVLWAWGLRKSNEYANKIEELKDQSLIREDERDVRYEAKLEKLLAQQNERHARETIRAR